MTTVEQALHQRAVENGRKGGLKTLEAHGKAHFVKASKKAAKKRKKVKSKVANESRVK